MNSISKFSLSLVLLITLAFAPALAQSENIGNIPEGRYLVIGTFHIKRNAVGFTNYVKKKNQFNVRLDYYPPEKYYYVYIKSYPPGEDGLKAVSLMRKETEFIDTWFMEVEPYANSGKNKPFVAEKKDNSGGSPGWVAVSTKKKTKNDELPHIVETNSYTHVVGIDGQVIGMVGNDGNVRGVNGRVIGTISGNGNVRGASGQDIGVIGADNQIIGAYGQVVGTLATNKSMIGALGTYAKVIDDKGNILGAVEANGKVRGLDGEIIGTLGSKGKVIGTDGEEIGVVGTYGQAISTEGKVIGTMNSDGKVIGAGGKVIGTRGANGKAIGLNGAGNRNYW